MLTLAIRVTWDYQSHQQRKKQTWRDNLSSLQLIVSESEPTTYGSEAPRTWPLHNGQPPPDVQEPSQLHLWSCDSLGTTLVRLTEVTPKGSTSWTQSQSYNALVQRLQAVTNSATRDSHLPPFLAGWTAPLHSADGVNHCVYTHLCKISFRIFIVFVKGVITVTCGCTHQTHGWKWVRLKSSSWRDSRIPPAIRCLSVCTAAGSWHQCRAGTRSHCAQCLPLDFFYEIW